MLFVPKIVFPPFGQIKTQSIAQTFYCVSTKHMDMIDDLDEIFSSLLDLRERDDEVREEARGHSRCSFTFNPTRYWHC